MTVAFTPPVPAPPRTLLRGAVRRSLTASLWDGVFVSLMMGLVDSFLTPFGLALKAGPRQIGWLTSFPPLFGALAQWWTGRLTRLWNGRKKVLTRVVYAQAFTVAGLAALPWLPAPSRIPLLILLATLYAAFGGLSGPVWNSLMSDYLPPSKRTGYYGWRNRITGAVVIAAALLAGVVLQRFGRGTLVGFSCLFAGATLCRFVSAAFLEKMYEPAVSRRSLPAGRFRHFWRETRGGPFWPFALYAAGLTFSANLSGPYFPVYMLRGLKFSYLTYTILMMAVNLSTVSMMAAWGRKADQAGPLKVLQVCTWLTPLLPLLWLTSQSPWPIFFVQIFGGVVWSGLQLCQINYIFDAVPSRLRTQAIAYFNVVNGMALFAGAFLGGYLLEILPPLLGFRFLTLLQISGVLRVLVALFLLPRVPAVRTHSTVSGWDVFYGAVGLKPLAGFSRDILHMVRRWGR